jgi:hypothetical protein
MCGCRYCRGLNDQPTKGCCPNCDNVLIMRLADLVTEERKAEEVPGATVTVGGAQEPEVVVYEITQEQLQAGLDEAAHLGTLLAAEPRKLISAEHAFVVGQILGALKREELDCVAIMNGELFTDTLIVLGGEGTGFRITVRPV